MAAAEYFSNAPLQPTSYPYQQQQPQQRPQPPSYHSQPNQPIPQIQTHSPVPNYQQQNASHSTVHFAPTPVELHQRHSFSGQQRPSITSQTGWNNSPYNNPYPQQSMALQQRPPQSYGSPHSSGNHSPQQRPQHLAPHMRPYANPNSSQYSLEHGYSSDPEPHRRKHKQKKRRDSDEKRSGKSRSTKTDGLLGAAGGGLIGDLIFPGLGTVGGAALGFIGGRDYGKSRKNREENLAIAQREWEEKHRPDRRSRDRSRGHRSRDGSTELGERDRPRSYERYKSDY